MTIRFLQIILFIPYLIFFMIGILSIPVWYIVKGDSLYMVSKIFDSKYFLL